MKMFKLVLVLQALNFICEGAMQFSTDKGHFYKENVNLYWNFAEGTTAIAVGAVRYFEAWCYFMEISELAITQLRSPAQRWLLKRICDT